MKPFWKEVCFAAVMGLVVPAVLLGLAVKLIDLPEEQELTQVTERTDQTGPVGETQPAADPVRIDVLMDGTITSMELEEYLVGVVLAEMPVDFEEEARKAQAVVARTFTLRSREGGKHDTPRCARTPAAVRLTWPQRIIWPGAAPRRGSGTCAPRWKPRRGRS